MMTIKNVCYANEITSVFVGWSSTVLIILSSVVATIFLGWALSADNNEWSTKTRLLYADQAGCAPMFNDDEFPQCRRFETNEPCFFNADKTIVTFSGSCNEACADVYEECLAAFIIWANPLLAALSLLVLGMIFKFLKPNNSSRQEKVVLLGKMSAVVFFIFWVIASLSGAGAGLSGALIAFALAIFVGGGIVITAVFQTEIGSGEIDMQMIDNFMECWKDYLDIVKGLFVIAALPFLIVYAGLSAANQFVRTRISKQCISMDHMKFETEMHHDGCFTKRFTMQLEVFQRWNHSKILTFAAYWGIFYVILNVLVTKFTIVFLSWLIDATKNMDLTAVTGIVVGVGLLLFLLPPIPGVPIYLTGGIILVSVGRDSLGITGAIAYTCAISLGLKLLACTLQQVNMVSFVFQNHASCVLFN